MIARLDKHTQNFVLEALGDLQQQPGTIVSIECAESFIILAANAGFFGKVPPQRYPKKRCQITLHHLQKRDYIVRNARIEDLETLYELEDLCWGKLQTPQQQIKSRLEIYPQGQFVLEKNDSVVGVIYSQRIKNCDLLHKQTMHTVHHLHDPSGEIVQLLAVNIHPQQQNLALGDQLLEFMLQRCSVVNGVNKVVGVTLCKNYDHSIAFDKYIHKRNEYNLIQDPILAFHESHGATIAHSIKNYRPSDEKNAGYGVLVTYDIHNRVAHTFTQKNALHNSSISTAEIRNFISELIQTTLREDKQAFSLQRPLMEMGLDSADLLEMQAQISQKYDIPLPSGFFFEYNSPQKVLDYLATQLGIPQKTTPVPPKQTLAQTNEHTNTDIAIVGMSCKLPQGIATPEQLWELLKKGESAISTLPQNRFSWPEDIDVTTTHVGIDHGGFIHDIEHFDARFFRISPKEAQCMDPQQRILLELAWGCFENAAIVPQNLPDRNIGVFIGASGSDYAHLLREKGVLVEAHHGVGTSLSILANRISYFFDFHGPSLQIDTACSSSLVAVHNAVQSLRCGECSQALVGGIHLICYPANSIAYYKAGMLAKDGKCKTFDARANGYVRSEGAVMFLLKPLEDAIENHDYIHAIIKGSATNHGGLSGGLTVPDPKKQQQLLTQAWKNARVSPSSLSFIEAHGTGTSLGDPIEVQGIQNALATDHNTSKCGIGSLKSNIGHLEAAAGIAGMLKAVLCLQKKQLPASIHFQNLNRKIVLPDSSLYVISKHQKITSEKPLYAGISSFGSGGTNAHVVIAPHPLRETPQVEDQEHLFVLSAKNLDALRLYVTKILTWLEKHHNKTSLGDFIYTLQVGRTPLPHRLAIKVDSFSELRSKLQKWLAAQKVPQCWQQHAQESTTDTLLQQPSAALQNKNLPQLAQLWTSGVNIDWQKLYTTPLQRIPIPSYPFAKQAHWLQENTQHPVKFFVKKWQRTVTASTNALDRAIVLYDKNTQTLAEYIYNKMPQAILINRNELAITTVETYLTSMQAFIDLTGMEEDAPDLSLPLLQHILKHKRLSTFVLVYVTRGVENYQNECIQIQGAKRVGLYRMLQSEYPAIKSRHVDLDRRNTNPQQCAQQILHEICRNSAEIEVCYRNNTRYVSILQEKHLSTSQHAISFTPSQVLLVTGGTRGLGWLCARHFVQNYGVKRVVLTGKTPIPPQEQWTQRHTFSPLMQQRIENIQSLQSLGAQVKVITLALDNNTVLQQQYDEIVAEMGDIAAIIHAAGIVKTNNPAFVHKAPHDIQQTLLPKVSGLQNLMATIPADKLQFTLLFSSVAAIIPRLGAGYSDYATANSFMDYFAHQQKIVSIQWPSWKETGVGEITSAAYRETGLLAMTNAQGLAVVDQVLANLDERVLMPVVIDPQKFVADQLLDTKSKTITPTAKVNTMQIANDLHQWLLSLFSQELGIKPQDLDIDTPFPEYGIDSIFLAQILHHVQQELNEEFEASVLFEHYTIEKFANWLQSHYSQKIAMKFAITNASSAQVTTDSPKPLTTAASSAQVTTDSPKPSTTTAKICHEKVAVVGMACRFPHAENIEQYWNLLREGQTAISPIPTNCWGIDTNYHAALINDVYGFDPAFFLIAKEDAQMLDPQALILLEESLKAIYHAGYTHQQLTGKNIGVYIGARSQNATAARLEKTRNPIMVAGQNYLAANIAQFFNFSGPALVVDTACSSSLVAMNIAIEAIRAGTIEGAIVGGISLLTDSTAHETFAKRNLLAEDGQFHIFDERAHGVVLGEGCGVVYLKSLPQAKQDQNSIYSIVSGISVNNDGRTAGPATPNLAAQKAVMHAAWQQSGQQHIQYLEVNGSGSLVTDLLELKAITATYAHDLYLGCVKPNIGHPLCAEGIASFIKVTLMLHHQSMVPFLSAQQPLPYLQNSGFKLPRSHQEIAIEHAAVNCFADGGTNVHVILQAHTSQNHKPAIPLPSLQRIDVRGGDVAPYIENQLHHRFEKSQIWHSELTINHPLIANHKAYGQSLLPGLAWIDFLYQWFAEAGFSPQTLQLKNLAIYHPCVAHEESSIALSVVATQIEKMWKVRVENSTTKINYISAEMHTIVPVAFDEVVDLDTIANSVSCKDLQELYENYSSYELVHSGVLKARGKVFTDPSSTWVHTQVHDKSPTPYIFHPTLIDSCVIAASVLFLDKMAQQQRLFLPLFYESFVASEPLNAECYARISSYKVQNDLISFDVAFFTATGRQVAELKNLQNKLVRNPQLINPLRKEATTQITTPHNTNLDISDCKSLDEFLQRVIAAKVSKKPEQIATQCGYYELGIDSAMLLEVVHVIEEAFSIKLPPTILFEYTTIQSLANHLTQNYPLQQQRQQHIVHGNFAQKKPHKKIHLTTTHVPAYINATPQQNTTQIQDIAVVGMSGLYPQAANLHEFWENLKAGKDCICEVPKHRWDYHDLDHLQSPSGKPMSRWGGFIDDVDCFDPQFFRISPREAATIDPQERLFLQICWEAMEDAGYTPHNIVTTEPQSNRKRVGVFVGVMHKDYTLLQNEAMYNGEETPMTLSYAQIANRVSYFCDFHGPSLTIDTVCSSSLTAVHLAMESISKGESKVAIAGGVNLSLHPSKYITYGLMNMHASDGRCRTFGEGGDGYVSAEGVGAIVLKPLQQAIDDNDSIYAVLKGSSVNHVGTTSGITVPSPVAQGEMIIDCLQKTNIDPTTISYIEAHGTGTSLGDPIEIAGLKRAFQKFTTEQHFCSLGSVKSNIGHAESAAGISGLTKVILQLHHKTLVKSLHSEVINPYLDIACSPFYVQTLTETWPLPKCQVRRAGVSSFGAMGSNAHVIAEEFSQPQQLPVVEEVIILLSADNITRLQEYVQRLVTFLQQHPQTNIVSFAYTLQVGRIAMKERLAFVAHTVEEVITKLCAWQKNTHKDVHHTRIQTRNNSDLTAVIFDDEDIQHAIVQWMHKRKHHKLIQLWLQGYTMDWQNLYPQQTPQRMHLPTYPFAKERYWVAQTPQQPRSTTVFHPLLHENTSLLGQQRFTSTFTGKELFLQHHQLQGQKVLPGVAYLEMARIAIEKSSEHTKNRSLELKNIVWPQPLVVEDSPQKIHIALSSQGEEIHYRVYSNSTDEKAHVYSQGLAYFKSQKTSVKIPITQLKQSISETIDRKAFYDAFQRLGINYGDSHRAITEIHRAPHQALARLRIANCDCDVYVLPPGLMDSALQCCVALTSFVDQQQIPMPFALESIEIIDKCSREMYVWVRHGDDSSDKLQKWDIDLCDLDGNVCVALRGFCLRAMQSQPQLSQSHDATMFLVPTWETTSISQSTPRKYTQHHIVLCEIANNRLDTLQRHMPHCQYLSLQSQHKQIEDRYCEYAIHCFELLRHILETKPQTEVVVQVVVSNPLFCGLIGLLRTANLENSKIIVQIIHISTDEQIDSLARKLQQSITPPYHDIIRYNNGHHEVQVWKELPQHEPSQPLALKKDGVYLISGGLGGLGLLFANEIIRQTTQVTLILSGRSQLSTQTSQILQRLSSPQVQVEYRQVDVCMAQHVSSLVEEIIKKYGKLNGVIHSAGAIADNFIVKKTSDEFKQILTPKVNGTVNLDSATAKVNLDFFMVFSSIAVMGNVGQADYAAANAFMDQFIVERNRQVQKNQRQGHSISINWPLWQQGGMQVSDAVQARMKKHRGMTPLPTAEGLKSFQRILAGRKAQVMVVHGQPHKLRKTLQAPSISSSQPQSKAKAVDRSKVRKELAHIVSQLLRIEEQHIELEIELSDYGIDSIMMMEMIQILEKKYHVDFPHTVLIEYPTIELLCDYFVTQGIVGT